MNAREQAGFTLIEIMVALAILGGAMYILLDNHLTTLHLYDAARQQVTKRMLVEEAIGRAEVEIFAGTMNGGDEFGKRFEGYQYSFAAQQAGDSEVALYQVAVTVEGPDIEETVTYFLYDIRY